MVPVCDTRSFFALDLAFPFVRVLFDIDLGGAGTAVWCLSSLQWVDV